MLLDTNVVVTLLLKSPERQLSSPVMRELYDLPPGDAVIMPEVVAETTYVLQSYYHLTRDEISKAWSGLLQNDKFTFLHAETVARAVEYFCKLPQLAWIDCALLAQSKVLGERILTMDHALNLQQVKMK